MPIRITAKKDGYCRVQTVFRAVPTVYPDGHFDPRELMILRADPNLTVSAEVSGIAEIPKKKSAGKFSSRPAREE